tara:strand:+ start:1965 stop:2213 length:249 start_codon:yes stop_codon:yes gene_type:complete
MSKKITKEELTTLKEAVDKLNQKQLQLGIIETQKHEILHLFAVLQEDLLKVRKDLEQTYGKVNISVADGTITEIKDESNKED